MLKERLIKERFFLIWFLGCLIIISRRPGVLFDAQLWSEDGFIFLDEAIRYGWRSFIIPYAGYIHLLPRTITCLSLQLSEFLGQGIVWVPTIMNTSTVALSSFCAIYICSSKFHWMGHIYFRMLLCLFILVFPNAYEVWGNVTNLHWWFGILEFFLLWHLLQNRKMPTWRETLLLSVVVLTSPNGLLVLPAILWAYFRVKKNKPDLDILKIILVFALTLVQLHFLLDARVPKDANISLLFNNAIDYVFKQLLGNLLAGRAISSHLLSITGAFFLFAILYFSWGAFKKLYIPFAFLFAVISMTALGADLQGYKYGRYIFVPTVVIFSILIYEGKLHWRKRSNHLFSIAKIALLALFFLLISFRVVRNYPVESMKKYPWKTQATLFEPDGKIFYHFPINPVYWSVTIPSSFDRDAYIPSSSTKITLDNSHIVRLNDIQRNDSLFTITGPLPEITYQLPDATTIAYCRLDFEYPLDIKTGQISFFSSGSEASMIFHVKMKNLITAPENVPATVVKFVRFIFFETIPNDSFIIKHLDFYTPASE